MLDAFPWDVGLSLVVSGSRVTIIIQFIYELFQTLATAHFRIVIFLTEISNYRSKFQPKNMQRVCHIDNLAKRIVLLNIGVGLQYRLWHSHEYRHRVLTDNLKEISSSFRKYYIFLCLNIFQFIHQTSEMTEFDWS